MNRVLCFISFLLLFSCNQNQKAAIIEQTLDTPYSGKLTISVDATIMPILQQEAQVFQNDFKEATLNLVAKPETDVVNDLASGKVTVISIPRQLTPDELQPFKKAGYTPEQVAIGYDGLVFIVNNANADTSLTEATIVDILKGKTKNWGEIDVASKQGDIHLIFDNNHSSAVNYIAKEILKGQPMASNAYAMKNDSEVMHYVSANSGAIGVISMSAISDIQDSSVQVLLKGFRVVGISSLADPALFVKPLKSHLRWYDYPFKRAIYLINAETHSGLGTGFASFIASDRGQTIVSRAGLLPASNATRMIEIKHN